MIVVPFVYFSALCGYFTWKHKHFGAEAWMAFLYGISALASIPVFYQDLIGMNYGTTLRTIGLVPTVLYCTLLTLTILPFSNMNAEKIKTIECPKPWLFKTVSWILIFTFFCTVLVYLGDIRKIFAIGDLKMVRDMVYHNESVAAKITGIRYILALPDTLFSALGMVAIPFFLYSLCFCHNKWWFNGLLLLASTTAIVKSILIAGRTQTIYWIFTFVACYLFFSPMMKASHKHAIRILFTTLFSIVLLFFAAITAARYSNVAQYAVQMLLLYIGEPFVEFCYFWDFFQSPDISFQRLLPFTHQFILGKDIDLSLYRAHVTAKSGLFIGVFFTFLGDLLIDIGRFGMMVYVILYHITTRLLLRRKDPQVMPFHQILLWLMLILLPLEGLFYYSYHTVRMSYYVIETILLVILFKYRIRLWHKSKNSGDTAQETAIIPHASHETGLSSQTDITTSCPK